METGEPPLSVTVVKTFTSLTLTLNGRASAARRAGHRPSASAGREDAGRCSDGCGFSVSGGRGTVLCEVCAATDDMRKPAYITASAHSLITVRAKVYSV